MDFSVNRCKRRLMGDVSAAWRENSALRRVVGLGNRKIICLISVSGIICVFTSVA